VSVGDSAAEGGAWGIAVLAAFLVKDAPEQSLAEFLNAEVFAGTRLDTIHPDPEDVEGFEAFVQRFIAALPVEQAAIDHT
jgi:sugar (pentulose or hexulose) kinase